MTSWHFRIVLRLLRRPQRAHSASAVCRWTTLWLLLWLLPAAGMVRADVVTVANKANHPASKITGEILDFTGAGLVIRTAIGREETIAPQRVLAVETVWPAAYTLGEELIRQRKFSDAQSQFQTAIAAEKRLWAKRRIVARSIFCFAAMQQPERAGDLFLSLLKEDPQSPYFDTIPLSWLPSLPNATRQAHAERWLKEDASPASRLLGSSWLLAQGDRGRSVAALQSLINHADPRIAQLAEAQLWRTQIATATADEVNRWSSRIEELPVTLRAGPYFTVGQALTQQQRFEAAALAFLRIPILHPDHQALAAEALLAAARALEKMSQASEASVLYREIAARHADSTIAADAADRLRKLTETKKDSNGVE